MDVRELERQYGDFYVPAFKVGVGGRDLVRDLCLAVTSAEVDLKSKTAGRFSFTITNAFDWKERAFVANENGEKIDLLDLFEFGKSIELSFGYGDPSGLSCLLSGSVTEVTTSFTEGGGADLMVSGYDDLYLLTTGKNTNHWEEKRDSAVVEDLVRITGLRLQVEETEPEKVRIDQNQETDMAFLEKIAKRNAATFYARGQDFYFGPRRNKAAAVIELRWGKGLLSFAPEAKLARQVERVEVHGWSTKDGEPVVGKASKDNVSDRESSKKNGAEFIASAFNTEPVLSVRAAVHTQAEADARAKAILEERAQAFVTGEGESIGLPEIVPDVNVRLADIGVTFSKTYYVSEAKHKIGGNGYRTTFRVEETTA